MRRIRRLYCALLEGRYIRKGTPYGHFAAIFGRGPAGSHPIVWTASLNQLACLVYLAFHPDNKRIWDKAAMHFTTLSGPVDSRSLAAAYTALRDARTLRTLDPALAELAAAFTCPAEIPQ